MSQDNELIISARKLVGILIYDIISRNITPFEAIQKFPKDIEDTSIKIGWHAIIHFDSDEDIRKKDNLYAQEQMRYLESIGKILLNGEPLPENILQEYENLYEETVLPKKTTFKEYIKSIFRFI